MKDSTESKNHHRGSGGGPASSLKRRIYMASHEMINRLIPELPVSTYGGRVPPANSKSAQHKNIRRLDNSLSIKLAIAKAQNL